MISDLLRNLQAPKHDSRLVINSKLHVVVVLIQEDSVDFGRKHYYVHVYYITYLMLQYKNFSYFYANNFNIT